MYMYMYVLTVNCLPQPHTTPLSLGRFRVGDKTRTHTLMCNIMHVVQLLPHVRITKLHVHCYCTHSVLCTVRARVQIG